MKYMFTLCSILLSVTLFATVHTVDNGANSTADYTDLQEAIDEAAEGDTLLIKGSYIPYGKRALLSNSHTREDGIVLNKKLVLIGQGGYGHPNGPTFENRAEKTFLNTLVLSSTISSSASGSILVGIGTVKVSVGQYNDEVQTIENIEFRDSNLGELLVGNSDQRLNGLKIARSAFNGFEESFWASLENLDVTNSIIFVKDAMRLEGGVNLIQNSLVLVKSFMNVLTYDMTADGSPLLESEWPVENVKFLNSVIYMTGLEDSGSVGRLVFLSSNIELENNILINTFITRQLLDNGNIDAVAVNNTVEEDPFVRLPSGEGKVNELNDRFRANTATGNYHLKETSTGKAGGTDNTDIGLYGGEFPWVDGPVWRYDNEPSLPVIESLKLEKKTVKPGEGLKVRVRARAKGNQ